MAGPCPYVQIGVVPALAFATALDFDVPSAVMRRLPGDYGVMYESEQGEATFGGSSRGWAGMDEASAGDVVGLLLDLGSKEVPKFSVAVYQDGERLGIMVRDAQDDVDPGVNAEGAYWPNPGVAPGALPGDDGVEPAFVSDVGLLGRVPGGLCWCVQLQGHSAHIPGGGTARVWIDGKPAPVVGPGDLEEDERKRVAMRERQARHDMGEYTDDEDSD